MAPSAAPSRILYVTDSPTVSGAEHVLLSYLTRLPGVEFAPHVFLRASNQRLRSELDALDVPYTATQSFSERVIRTTLKPDDLLHFAWAFLRVRREMVAVCRAEGISAIHSISYPAALYAALAAQATGVPHIWHEHGVKRIHTLNRAIYRFTAATCSYVIGPSDAVTGALSQAGLRPPVLRTVYNGIDLERFAVNSERIQAIRAEFGLAPGQSLVGLVGQLLPHKGHHTLIAAAPQILQACPDARFLIVGALENPPYEKELRDRVAAAGLTDAFIFTGWRTDVQDIIGALDVSVVATLTPEPAALSLMETMALGRPLVASRSGGTPELVPDGVAGRLFTPGDAVELASLVVELLRHPEQARALGSRGRKLMEERFSEQRHIQEIRSLYQACLVGRVQSLGLTA
jgi:glycosyltransferase involved in cell wall biosynthesis